MTSRYTALGPAMLIAVAMASKAAGSKVIMCTDGLANRGIGSLDPRTFTGQQSESSSSEFYVKVGNMAKRNGLDNRIQIFLV